MENKLIVDFDGTLINENSTRVLEVVIFEAYVGRCRRILHWSFFGLGEYFTNRFANLLTLASRRQIDWRFRLFLRLCGARLSRPLGELIDDAASRLTLNEALLQTLVRDEPTLILSCGCAQVIEAFLRTSNLNAYLLKASQLRLNKSGRPQVEMVEPRDKVAILLEFSKLKYVTDDRYEAELVSSGFLHSGSKDTDMVQENNLFHVTKY
jgi:hypothetical protein